MRRRAIHAISLAVLAAVGLVVAVLLSPGTAGLTIEIYLFVVAALVVAGVLLWVSGVFPRAEHATIEQPPRSQAGRAQLESIARALDLAEASSFDLYSVLRPIVREIAAARLARHGVSLDRQPERARALLGASTWDLVRSDREAPARWSSRGGCRRDELRAIVDSLEAI